MNIPIQPLPHILQRCRDGDQPAIEDLFHTYQEPVFRLALTILDDGRTPTVIDEAEEVAQDVLIAMLAALDGYNGEATFTTWLYSITLNACRSRLRKRGSLGRMIQGLQNLFIRENEDSKRPEERVVQNEQNAALWQAIQALDEKHRLPVILHYYHDLGVSEIAAVMNLPAGTVLSRLYTARERLRVRLPADTGQPTGIKKGVDPHKSKPERGGMR